MKFILECSTRYLTSERSERVVMRYRFEHEKRNFISPSNHVLFCLFFKPTNNEGFGDFPKISDNFTKISEDFKNVVRYSNECFRTFSELFRKFSNFPEDFRRKSEDSSINIDKIGSFSIYWKVIFPSFRVNLIKSR